MIDVIEKEIKQWDDQITEEFKSDITGF